MTATRKAPKRPAKRAAKPAAKAAPKGRAPAVPRRVVPAWESYAEAVATEREPASRFVRLAAERFLGELSRWGTKPGRAYRFDEAEASRVVRAFPALFRHHKGEWAGRAFELEAWQQFLVAQVFGWRAKDGRRRFRKAYVEVPRKNGKSQIAAGVGLLLLCADGEPGAEVYSAATKRDQALLVHDEATRMVKSSPALARRVGAFRHNLHVTATHSKFEPLSADFNTLDGLNPHGVIVDELHAHRSRDLLDVLETAMGARRQPLLFLITTAGHGRASVCWELHEYGRQVLEGTVEDPSFLAYIAGADAGDDWTEPATWRKANPNLGVSVKEDYLRRECEQAQAIPSKQAAFRRLHLNDWTEQRTGWLPLEAWDACAGAVDPEELAGRRCYVGLDLSTSRDVTAAVAFFPPEDGAEDGEPGAVLPQFWIPADNVAERVRSDGVPFDAWAEAGLVTLTPGNVVDYAWVREWFHALRERWDFEVVEVAYDPWGAVQLATELQEDGFLMVPMRQGFQSMAPALRELERLVLGRRLAHGGHPVLRWMAGNVAVKLDPAGNAKPDKSAAADRIDGIVALAMAVGRASLAAGAREVDPDELLMVL